MTQTANTGVHVDCDPAGITGIKVTIATWVFDKINIAPMSTHLDGPIVSPCYKTLHTFLIWSWMEYYVPLDAVCGTTVVSTATDITFSNNVLGLYRISLKLL